MANEKPATTKRVKCLNEIAAARAKGLIDRKQAHRLIAAFKHFSPSET